jgi:predicted nucleic acid-binding protein
VIAYLVDVSVLARTHRPAVADALHQYAGQLATCSTLLLDVGSSARDAAHYDEMMNGLSSYLPLAVDQDALDLATALQRQLVRLGAHRGPRVADLLLAAVAIRHGAVLLHHNEEFELIAGVDERLHARWIVPPGSAD